MLVERAHPRWRFPVGGGRLLEEIPAVVVFVMTRPCCDDFRRSSSENLLCFIRGGRIRVLGVLGAVKDIAGTSKMATLNVNVIRSIHKVSLSLLDKLTRPG